MNAETNPFNRSFDHLEALADAIGEVLQAPVTIEDANHRLLAYSKHDLQTDPARIATIIGRRVPESVIGSLWKDGVIPKLMETDEPVRVKSIHDVGLGDRVAVSIRKDRQVLGYIWALEVHRPLDREALKQLKLAAAAAKIKLLRLQTQRRKEDEERRDLFWELLTGHHQTAAQTKAKARTLGIVLPDTFCVVIIHFVSEMNEKLQQIVHYMITTTQRVRPVLSVISGNQLIVLVTDANSLKLAASAADFAASFCQQIQDRTGCLPPAKGIGAVYEDITSVEQSYKEALTVLQIQALFPAETGAIVHYHELGYYRYLPYFLEQKKLHKYENPSLKRLRAYDREHQSNLLETLETFLVCGGNAKEAADALHVHTNTLSYRLKRIAEIGEIDLANVDQRMTLFLDMKTDKWSDGEPL
ncbi:PucR family transcriptional regulator [Paenibacillus ginsengarvi]|uniref:PucR family transcriptional regulator n=1 Tax=Paenibacillus ginsengarvi TaxID=400777 RepID=A0A3B0CUP5_9BACL|nr:helix-turn-helix domain-containing protein [Paenibacillus ginsengarvi]RKN86667.1 PucR family transcriptional regulator [Paenibacillus ginsengarvi]